MLDVVVALLRDRVKSFSAQIGWDERAENRLMLAVEEAVLFLCEERESQSAAASALDAA